VKAEGWGDTKEKYKSREGTWEEYPSPGPVIVKRRRRKSERSLCQNLNRGKEKTEGGKVIAVGRQDFEREKEKREGGEKSYS